MERYYTVREIAEALGTSKQKVYRWLRENRVTTVTKTVTNGQTKRYDETVVDRIKSDFAACQKRDKNRDKKRDKTVTKTATDDTVLTALLKQLEAKDKQIQNLMTALDQEQKLRAMSETKVALLEEKEQEYHKTIFGLYKKK